MAHEIERKFLVVGDDWRRRATGTKFRQGYLSTEAERAVRVRTKDDTGYLTIKGESQGSKRMEFEYEIPRGDAEELLDQLCLRPLIEKTRYRLDYRGMTWEIDEFFGENEGLILAEVELVHENQTIDLPPWVGKEVTHDGRYYNANLIQHPYRKWKHD